MGLLKVVLGLIALFLVLFVFRVISGGLRRLFSGKARRPGCG